jgi:hypothetical protein
MYLSVYASEGKRQFFLFAVRRGRHASMLLFKFISVISMWQFMKLKQRIIPVSFGHGLLTFARKYCGLVVRIPGYRSRGPRFDFRRYHIFGEVVRLEQGLLGLVKITEELFERKRSGSCPEN